MSKSPIILLLLMALVSTQTTHFANGIITHSSEPQLAASQNRQHSRHSRPTGIVQNGAEAANARPAGGEQRAEDLFRQYLNKGMFGCGANYVSVLQKLNKLIVVSLPEFSDFRVFKMAHQEYAQCKSQMQRTEQTAQQSRKLAEQLEMIHELFGDDDWVTTIWSFLHWVYST